MSSSPPPPPPPPSSSSERPPNPSNNGQRDDGANINNNSSNIIGSRIDLALQERAQQQQQGQFIAFVQRYGLNLVFPAQVVSSSNHPHQADPKELRTNVDLINARLLENGILFDDLQTLPQIELGVQRVVNNLMRTQNFNSVQIEIDKLQQIFNNNNNDDFTDGTTDNVKGDVGGVNGSSIDNQQQQQRNVLKVILDEKKWYSLYVGGGIKHEGMEEAMNGGGGFGGMGGASGSSAAASFLPKAQFETRLALQNLTGYLDRSMFQYTIDQTSTSQFLVSHERPFYSWFPEDSLVAHSILSTLKGSQYSLGVKALIDTVDYESTRSYKEHLRMIQCKLDNVGGGITRPEMAPTGGCYFDGNQNVDNGSSGGDPPQPYWCIDWSLGLRDIVPRKSPSMPYCADASHEVVRQSGPSLQHSIKYTWRTNGCYTDSKFQPTIGVDGHASTELSGPPGDVGYAKVEGGGTIHVPVPSLSSLLSFHGTLAGGILKPLSFGGLCKPPTISDRFFVGGPLQLRGFLPAGIGPRSSTPGGSTSPGGDALGGNMYYVTSLAASFNPPNNTFLSDYGIRLFAFCNAGTLVGTLPSSVFGSNGSIKKNGGRSLAQILQTTRTSAGVGLSAGTPMGRVELTYAIPIRYGPKDARRNLQFGFGFNFG